MVQYLNKVVILYSKSKGDWFVQIHLLTCIVLLISYCLDRFVFVEDKLHSRYFLHNIQETHCKFSQKRIEK